MVSQSGRGSEDGGATVNCRQLRGEIHLGGALVYSGVGQSDGHIRNDDVFDGAEDSKVARQA